MQNLANLRQATSQDLITHPNREGAPAYRRSLQEQVVQVLTTGTLGDTFYAKGRDLAAEAVQVLVQARTECPGFLARALIYAREQGLMKTLPLLGLVVLSGGRKTARLFLQIFARIVRTPDDLRQFVAMCLTGTVPGRKSLGGVTRLAVREWLGKGISEYHVVKYGSAASMDVTLRDILRLTHPQPASLADAERFGWLVRGFKGLREDVTLNPQIRALESLKRATTEDETIALIRQGRLPYEVVVPAVRKTSPAIWGELLRQAPYFNLLRNLRTFTRHGVFQQEENVCYAVAKLTSSEAVKHSRVLPFRFFDAWRQLVADDEIDGRITDALRAALNLSFVNLPSFGSARVALGIDVSGSMGWGRVSERGQTRYIDIAGIFAGAILRRIENRAYVLPFDTEIRASHERFSARDDILVTAEKLTQYGGGGTAVGAPAQYLLDRKIEVDLLIGVTDGEDWAYGSGYYSCGSFLELWRHYRKVVNPNAQAYLVNLAPYRDAVAPQGEPGVHFISGWSDSVIRFIQLSSSGSGQVAAIERIDLESTAE